MAVNVIFGSGIVALLAKKILAGNWQIVPFWRSRFYSFNPPLADNFITRDAEIDDAIRDLTGSSNIFFYRRCYSYNGQLLSSHDDALSRLWLEKVFGSEHAIPGQAIPYFSKRLTIPIYDVRVNLLYQSLQREFLPALREGAALGEVTEVGEHYFVRGGVRIDFDRVINTIPLPALCKLMKKDDNFESRNEYFILVKSPRIDLEGHNQSFVVDQVIDFYKVTTLAPQLYMFCSTVEISQPGSYLLPIIGNADIIDGTCIPSSIPIGQLPDLNWLDNYGIFCVGSQAQWDWCADVGSNLLRIVRYAARNYS